MIDAHQSETPPEHMGRRWLGLGNLESKCWFVGLEPGGTATPDWPERWEKQFGAPEVMDGRADRADPQTEDLFGAGATLQKTWGALIRLRLAYAGEETDDASCLRYQRERFVAVDGREALLELSAYPARNMLLETDRLKYTVPRVARIRELMVQHKPEIIVCYGLSRRLDFEYLCGGQFDDEGFRRAGPTLCALTIHPTPRFQPAPPAEYWINLGTKMRNLVQASSGA